MPENRIEVLRLIESVSIGSQLCTQSFDGATHASSRRHQLLLRSSCRPVDVDQRSGTVPGPWSLFYSFHWHAGAFRMSPLLSQAIYNYVNILSQSALPLPEASSTLFEANFSIPPSFFWLSYPPYLSNVSLVCDMILDPGVTSSATDHREEKDIKDVGDWGLGCPSVGKKKAQVIISRSKY
ncbi:hypothetical protein LENED_011253 [Lentinula edodes]|uniref:Uncharacterized protein n=1 Tax=Lentinula edodes TaxID=5353 RepID=A0A1Q3EPJ5_LENED|nr:hypothetical protein LENED_011253 [Lentinula edodes]